MVALAARLMVCPVPLDLFFQNARHTAAPRSTISLFRMCPAARPFSFHAAGCGSVRMPMRRQMSSVIASAPVGQSPCTTTTSAPAGAFRYAARRACSIIRRSVQDRDPVTRMRYVGSEMVLTVLAPCVQTFLTGGVLFPHQQFIRGRFPILGSDEVFQSHSGPLRVLVLT